VPLAFDAATVTALRAGTSASVSVTANDSGQELAFSISLNGFASALDRVAGLNGS
jgi:invasion protein IalB